MTRKVLLNSTVVVFRKHSDCAVSKTHVPFFCRYMFSVADFLFVTTIYAVSKLMTGL